MNPPPTSVPVTTVPEYTADVRPLTRPIVAANDIILGDDTRIDNRRCGISERHRRKIPKVMAVETSRDPMIQAGNCSVNISAGGSVKATLGSFVE